MKKYKVLKEFINPVNLLHFKVGDEFSYNRDGDRTFDYVSVLAENGFLEKIPEQPKTVWDLKEGDEYYLISSSGDVCKMTNISMSVLAECASCGSCFLTEKEAQKELAHRKAKVILERDTKGFKPDWNDKNQVKWIVSYDTEDKIFDTDTFGWYDAMGVIYFANERDALESIKNHPNEWKIYLGVEE